MPIDIIIKMLMLVIHERDEYVTENGRFLIYHIQTKRRLEGLISEKHSVHLRALTLDVFISHYWHICLMAPLLKNSIQACIHRICVCR